MYFFTADQHFGHKNIIKFCNRPFSSVEEMDDELIKRHNEIVKPGDYVIHAGDFALAPRERAHIYISCLNGSHCFIRGSHDRWMDSRYQEIWEKTINGIKLVVCHYAMRTWAASHYNSFHLFGHSHGNLPPYGKSFDVGVDAHNFYPVSFDEVCEIMKGLPDNPGLVRPHNGDSKA